MKIKRLKPIDYVLKSERDLPESEQTVFVLKEMNSIEKARFSDEINEEKVGAVETSIIFVHRSILDIKNIFDEDGNPLKVGKKDGHIDSDTMDLIEYEVIDELAQYLGELSGLFDIEKK